LGSTHNGEEEVGMNKFVVLAVGGVIMLCLSLSVFAEDKGGAAMAPPAKKGEGITSRVMPQVKSYPKQAAKKLMRGATNLGRAGTEFYFQPVQAKKESGTSISMLWPGAGEAAGMFLTRLMGGLIEVVTFPAPFPNGWQPLLDE
jgi:hypothetical protein